MTRSQLFRLALIFIFSYLLVTFYNNCSPSHKSYNSELPGNPDISGKCLSILKGAFRDGFYQWMRTKGGRRCSGCHMTGGGSEGKGPGYFADDNFNVAFSHFRSRVDSVDSRAKSAHQGAGVNDPNSPLINGFKSDYDEAQKKYDSCMVQEGEEKKVRTFETVDKVMGLKPQSGLGKIRFKQITFSLETELTEGDPVAAAHVTISVAYVKEGDDYVYYFTNPTLSTGLAALTLRGLYISINGLLQQSLTTWRDLEMTIPSNQYDVVLSEFTTLVVREGTPTDTLSLSFDEIIILSGPSGGEEII